MTHGSLFSGIGGFDLAAQWMGWENVFHCEWNEFGKRVLSYYWPNAISYHDITETDFTIHAGQIDVLTGGFPCQPYSAAGKRLGKADDRHLWPEMLRAIREIQPRWIVGENVRGLTNWNGGLVFDEVQADLETAGYEVTPFLLPACGVNAPHRRDRIWFVAYSEGNNNTRNAGAICSPHERQAQERPEKRFSEFRGASNEVTPNSNGNGHELRGFGKDKPAQGEGIGYQEERQRLRTDDRGISEQESTPNPEPKGREGADWFAESIRLKPGAWDKWPTTQPTVRGRNDGISAELDGITFSKWRNESIKAYGNAVVPQVVYQIFKAIQQYETTAQQLT
jgi:DNA (cytosine-5)-methyltransferase 1